MSNPVTPLDPKQTQQAEVGAAAENYLKRVLVAADEDLNVVTDGLPGETISARAGRAALNGKWWGKALSRVLNFFQPDHGALSIAGADARAKAVEQAEEQSGGINK